MMNPEGLPDFVPQGGTISAEVRRQTAYVDKVIFISV